MDEPNNESCPSDLRVGIIGKGALGTRIADGIANGNLSGLVLASVLTRSVNDFDAFLENCDVVVEAAGRDAIKTFGPTVVAKGRTLVVLSVGALVDESLFETLSNGPGQLIVSAGAIGGLDLLRSLQISGVLESVKLNSRKRPSSFIQPWMSSEMQSSLKAELREIEVFKGSARDAVMRFPSNANIAAALAISGIGFDRTTVSLLADPTITKTKHTVDIASKIGTYRFEFINEISQENPKSSQLAAYSVLAELETFARAFGKPNRKTEK